MVKIDHISEISASVIWSSRLYGQFYQDKTVDHISETRCNNDFIFNQITTFRTLALTSSDTNHPVTQSKFLGHHSCPLRPLNFMLKIHFETTFPSFGIGRLEAFFTDRQADKLTRIMGDYSMKEEEGTP